MRKLWHFAVVIFYELIYVNCNPGMTAAGSCSFDAETCMLTTMDAVGTRYIDLTGYTDLLTSSSSFDYRNYGFVPCSAIYDFTENCDGFKGCQLDTDLPLGKPLNAVSFRVFLPCL